MSNEEQPRINLTLSEAVQRLDANLPTPFPDDKEEDCTCISILAHVLRMREARSFVEAYNEHFTNSLDPDNIHDYCDHHYNISFQEGPVGDVGVNGCQNEDIIEHVLLHRLRGLQQRFPCRENALAITKFEEGLLWLQRRTQLRIQQGVEGQNKAHRS